MRKIQLSFTIESFYEHADNGKRQVVKGYVDANNLFELLKEQIDSIRSIYYDDLSIDQFLDELKKLDYKRFGRTEINSKSEDFL